MDIIQLEIDNIIFLETKKNIIVDGNFTKIIYSDQNITFNGIYINLPIIFNINDKTIIKNNIFFNPINNIQIIKNILYIEEQIIEKYKKEFNVQKNNNLSLYNQLKLGKIKLYKEYNNNNYSNSNIVLKFSGIWETVNEVGIAYKFLEMHNILYSSESVSRF